jgi:hypothetical protein
MPFRSKAQRRYLYARHPKVAKRWTAEARRKGQRAVQPKRRKA